MIKIFFSFRGLVTCILLLLICLLLIGKQLSPNRKSIEYVSDQPFEGRLSFYYGTGYSSPLDDIKNALRNARESIEIAIYSFDSEELRNILVERSRSGCDVVLITDVGNEVQTRALFADVKSNIDLVFVTTPNGFMHHKFVIIDGKSQNGMLITGSLNYTDLQGMYDQTQLLSSRDEALISAFKMEYDLLKLGVSGTNKLNKVSYDGLALKAKYPNGTIELWFSPGKVSSSLRQRIAWLIDHASNNIQIINWQITDDEIARLLVDASVRGIDVQIITDDFTINQKHSVFPYMKEVTAMEGLSLQILTDESLSADNPSLPNSFVHHHAMIVDGETALFGSENWTNNGFFNNDGATMITTIEPLVNEYESAFKIIKAMVENVSQE